MKTPSMTKNAIRKRNKAFNKLTAPQKRVAIAKDVLAQIKAKNIKPMSGTYVFSEKLTAKLNDFKFKDTQFCELLPTVGTCQVCAKGALFLSTILKSDDLKVDDLTESCYSPNRHYVDDTDIGKYLANDLEVFSQFQLDLIENYFECNDGTDTFHERNDKERLVDIMENIVANKGTFNGDKLDKKYPEPKSETCDLGHRNCPYNS